MTGWFEYDEKITVPGWYQLIVHGKGMGVEFLVDADADGNAAIESHFYGGSGQNKATDKIANIWLTAGKHRFRVQRYYWTGFPDISAIELKKSSEALAESVAIAIPVDQRVFRKSECPTIEVISGDRTKAAVFRINETDPYTFVTYRTYQLTIPATRGLSRQRFALPCSEDGFRALWFGDEKQWIPNEQMRGIAYEVVDPALPIRIDNPRNEVAVLDIDCAKRSPDYFDGGSTTVVTRPFGSYRESGDTGLTRYQRAPELVRRALSAPSWFAYTLDGLVPQQRYRVEVDYPDDALRTFAIALRESAPLNYPVATGVNRGGEYLLSNTTQNLAFIVWPRAATPRLTFITAHDGSRAACSRIRAYRAETLEPLPEINAPGRRQFINWFEEGSNFPSMFGAPDDNPRGQRNSAERWAEAVTAVGGNVLMPTVAVYSFALYPSKINLAFSAPDQDMVRRLLLVAEKYRLKVVPELHPRADELAFGRLDVKQIPRNVMISREGKSNFFTSDGNTRNYPPYYNPLLPENQNWYIAMVGELADRYKDSPALDGISLRIMAWANPSLNNMVSLDWGYDDYTVGLFKRETGSAVPLGKANDPQRFTARHAWLTTTGRHAWIEWRCRKITALYKRIYDRIQLARPGLKIYVNTFVDNENLSPGFSRTPGTTIASRLRESGVDATMLNAINGVVVINSSHGYGRREAEGIYHGARDTLLDPASLGAMRKLGEGGRFITGANYLEATEVVAPPERLGFPASTKKTWMSAVSNPAGRNALERYAVALAETDAFTLGDGGNGYSFGPPIVREFMKEYRQLPAQSFAPRTDAIDPVSVRTLKTKTDFLFYVVNRERYPAKLDITFSQPGRLARMSDGESLQLTNGRLLLVLKPYELITVKADAGMRIVSIKTEVASTQSAQVERQIEWVGRLSRDSGLASLIRRGPNDKDRAVLTEAYTAARQAFNQGWFWRARTLLEHSSLLAIYQKIDCYPPALLSGEPHRSGCTD